MINFMFPTAWNFYVSFMQQQKKLQKMKLSDYNFVSLQSICLQILFIQFYFINQTTFVNNDNGKFFLLSNIHNIMKKKLYIEFALFLPHSQ